MIDGYNIVDNVQQPQLTFNETTAVETAAITTPGWYQIVVTKNAFIKIVREGQSALTVSPTTGFDIFAGIARPWYIPKNGKIGAIGAVGTGTGNILRFHRIEG